MRKGNAWRGGERRRSERIGGQTDLQGAVDYVGFVSGDAKTKLLTVSDCLCFPTYYPAEGQPVTLIEAMAFGLSIVTTSWRAIPEILPQDYPILVSSHSPQQIAAAFQMLFSNAGSFELRQHFLRNFTEHRHLELMESVCLSSELKSPRK